MAVTLITSEAAAAAADVAEVRGHGPGVALGWLAVFLIASGVVLAIGGHWALASLQVFLATTAVLVIVRMTEKRALRMIPVVLVAVLVVWPLLYFEVPLLISALGSTYHDVVIQRWEAALFRGQPSQTLASYVPWQWLSELLHAGYLAYYPAIFAPTLFLQWRKQTHEATRLVVALGIVYSVCWTMYSLFPVVGPRYLWPTPPGVPVGPMRSVAAHLLATGSSRGAAFPSSHIAATAVQAVVTWPADRRLSLVLAVVALLVGGGAIYGGFHYATDILAGAVLAVAAGLVVLRLTEAG